MDTHKVLNNLDKKQERTDELERELELMLREREDQSPAERAFYDRQLLLE